MNGGRRRSPISARHCSNTKRSTAGFAAVRHRAIRRSVCSSGCSVPCAAAVYCGNSAVREELKKLRKDYDKTEDDLKSLQSVGQIIGEVLRHLEEDKCTRHHRTHTHTRFDPPLAGGFGLVFILTSARR